jgi:hypothetical protein
MYTLYQNPRHAGAVCAGGQTHRSREQQQRRSALANGPEGREQCEPKDACRGKIGPSPKGQQQHRRGDGGHEDWPLPQAHPLTGVSRNGPRGCGAAACMGNSDDVTRHRKCPDAVAKHRDAGGQGGAYDDHNCGRGRRWPAIEISGVREPLSNEHPDEDASRHQPSARCVNQQPVASRRAGDICEQPKAPPRYQPHGEETSR